MCGCYLLAVVAQPRQLFGRRADAVCNHLFNKRSRGCVVGRRHFVYASTEVAMSARLRYAGAADGGSEECVQQRLPHLRG